jgi:CTP synthase
MAANYIFIVGGVSSSLGKGVIAASLGKLLQARGYSVTIQKLDPYINIDPGTLNPYEHGECFVTDDGAETDLDLGHYERFLNVPTSQLNNITSGRIYKTVIEQERKGFYKGKTVQVVPHITDEIKRVILQLEQENKYDFIITEVGGTVGDIESLPYFEAIRQIRLNRMEDCCTIHLTYIPYLKASGELKTKPTQHSVKKLQEYGIPSDILVCRTEHPLDKKLKEKVSLFCNVTVDNVIEARDAATIYQVPLLMQEEQLDIVVLKRLGIEPKQAIDLSKWTSFLQKYVSPKKTISIALVGKYVQLKDAYKSINEALLHAGVELECKVDIDWIDAEKVTKEYDFSQYDGMLVAPGFGERGLVGKLFAVQYAREHQMPFFGICFGMQSAVIEFARNVIGWQDANTFEVDQFTKHPVINLMEQQKQVTNIGGTLRLGAYNCALEEDSHAKNAYQQTMISERHRHRYEFNNAYLEEFKQAGMKITGVNPESNLVEVVELENHPWFVGVQYHPEYKSTVENPHPLFTAFLKAALQQKENR